MNFIECFKNARKIKILNLQSYLVDEYFETPGLAFIKYLTVN